MVALDWCSKEDEARFLRNKRLRDNMDIQFSSWDKQPLENLVIELIKSNGRAL